VSLIGKLGTGLVKLGGGIINNATGGALGGIIGMAGGLPKFGFPSAVTPGAPSPGIFGQIEKAFPGSSASSCPRGYHLNKKPLAACKSHGAKAARTMCVRNRSMNPMNYRALTKSLRRIKRAQKVVRKLHKFGTPQRRLPAGRPVAISENLRITSGGNR